MTAPTQRLALDLSADGGPVGDRAPSTVTAVVHEPVAPTTGARGASSKPDRVAAAAAHDDPGSAPTRGSGPLTAAPVLLLPGAGGSLDSEPLVALAEVVADAGHLVVRANLPHHERGGRAPRAATSVPTVGAILAAARAELGIDPARSWVLGGRSYGSRVASMAIAGGLEAAGLLCSGYPLHPPGQPERPRVEHWPSVDARVLFVQGDADPMADLALLRRHRRKLPRRSTLVIVAGGDHALRITRARSPDGAARSPSAALRDVAGAVTAWLDGLERDPDEPEPDGRGPDD